MSNDLRQAALAAALQIAKPTQSSLDVILVAQAFLGFLTNDLVLRGVPPVAAKAEVPPQVPGGFGQTDAPPKANAADATPVAKSAMPTAAKVAAKTPAPKPTKAVDTAASEGVESDGPTAEDVGKKINELLAADKQPEALAALKKYGAKSKSTLPVEHYGDFIADADKILMDA